MKSILYIGNKLQKHGNNPTSIDALSPLLRKEGYSVKAVSSIKNKAFRLMHMLSNILLSRNIETVLIDTYSTKNFWYAVLSAKCCQVRNIPYIFLLHGGKLNQRFEGSNKKILKLFRSAKANIVPSFFLKEKLKNFQFNNFSVIPNFIDVSQYSFKRREALKPKLLWVRAFAEVYNPKMMLKVFKLVSEKYPGAEACMVGPEKDGSLAEMKKLVQKSNLNIKFTGALNKSEWLEVSNEYDIFINTTNVDNTPVSLIEAMALGLPVISTKVGGIPYFISHEENGLLVPSGDSMEMANSILRLLEDPQLALKFSLNGRSQAEKFDWNEVKPLWLELLG